MAGSMATRSPRRGPPAITPAPSWPSTSGCVSLASPIAPSSNQCRSEPQMPTAVTRTRLRPAPGNSPAAGSGSSATRRSPTAWSLAARTRSSSRRPSGNDNASDPRGQPGITGCGASQRGGPACGPGWHRADGRRGGFSRDTDPETPRRPPLGGRAGRQRHGRAVRLAGRVLPADRDLVARVVLDQHLLDVTGGGDRLAADRGDRVALGQARAGRRRAGQGAGDGHPGTGSLAAEAAEPAGAAGAARVAARGLDAEEGGGADVD